MPKTPAASPAPARIGHNKPLPRGIRNNNPGNVLRSRTAWQGEKPWAPGDDEEFEVFLTPEDGIRAIAVTLLTYQRKHGLRTVAGMIGRWCPPVHTFPDGTKKPQDTAGYARRVAAAVGVMPDDHFDAARPDLMRPFLKAVIQQENGRQPYTDAQIDEGMRRAGIKF